MHGSSLFNFKNSRIEMGTCTLGESCVLREIRKIRNNSNNQIQIIVPEYIIQTEAVLSPYSSYRRGYGNL